MTLFKHQLTNELYECKWDGVCFSLKHPQMVYWIVLQSEDWKLFDFWCEVTC